MPILAIRTSAVVNGVSELHGRVARKMWHFLWPDKTDATVPIRYVTNGIHTQTWLARRMQHLFDEHLHRDWREHIDDPDVWAAVAHIPDSMLWETRRHLKRRLIHYMRERARRMWLRGGVHPVQIVAGGVMLDPYALTIGFARRFATYKRAALVLRDLPRLLKLVNNESMPVQIIFAGKAHPADDPGKQLIQEIYRQIKQANNGGRLVFLEDYDMSLARLLLQGVDVWLNTPRRPNEASGTSGQKAAINGALNFSILDGWWREGFNGRNGWAIGEASDSPDPEAQESGEVESLYRTLETEIIPLYYAERGDDGLPHEWLARVKDSIRTLAPKYSTTRMVKEYLRDAYLPALPDPKEG
jgi:starch phosphorylase